MRKPATKGGPPESAVRASSESTATTRQFPHQPSLFDDVPAEDDVMAGREQAVCNSDSWWMSIGLQAIRAIAKTGDEFQAFDLIERYHIPEPDHPNRWGPLFSRAARQGLIVPVGAAPSRRPRTARSLTRTWRGAP
jgi:hypothetical protein